MKQLVERVFAEIRWFSFLGKILLLWTSKGWPKYHMDGNSKFNPTLLFYYFLYCCEFAYFDFYKINFDCRGVRTTSDMSYKYFISSCNHCMFERICKNRYCPLWCVFFNSLWSEEKRWVYEELSWSRKVWSGEILMLWSGCPLLPI